MDGWAILFSDVPTTVAWRLLYAKLQRGKAKMLSPRGPRTRKQQEIQQAEGQKRERKRDWIISTTSYHLLLLDNMAATTAIAQTVHVGTVGAPPATQGVTAPALGIQSFYQSKIQSYVSATNLESRGMY